MERLLFFLADDKNRTKDIDIFSSGDSTIKSAINCTKWNNLSRRRWINLKESKAEFQKALDCMLFEGVDSCWAELFLQQNGQSRCFAKGEEIYSPAHYSKKSGHPSARQSSGGEGSGASQPAFGRECFGVAALFVQRSSMSPPFGQGPIARCCFCPLRQCSVCWKIRRYLSTTSAFCPTESSF